MRRLELTLLMLLVVLLIIVIKSRKDLKQSKPDSFIEDNPIEWSGRTYYDSNGVPIHPIDWSNRIHYDFQLNDYRIRTNRGDRQ